MSQVTKQPKASQDLIEIATHLYTVSPFSDVSERFLSAAERAFTRLAQMPGIGVAYDSPFGVSEGLRRWPVPDFRNYLIFYRPTQNGVSIVRVLHGSRDIAAALQQENDGSIEGFSTFE